MEVGRYESGGWTVTTPFGSVSGGSESRPIFKKGVNADCARMDEAKIKDITEKNRMLHEEKKDLVAIISSIDKGLAECTMLPNWSPAEPKAAHSEL